MNDKKYVAVMLAFFVTLILSIPLLAPVESAPDQATETTQLLVLSQLIDLNTNIIALDADIDVNNILSESNLQTFAIDGFSDRFFVRAMNLTNDNCIVFDKPLQNVTELFPCFEPFFSLTTPERLNYNTNYILP